MEKASKAILTFLLNKTYIGGKHFPEEKLINSKTKWLDKKEKKDFKREYKQIKNKEFILRSKKRTGKGSDWHISINPKKIEEVYDLLSNGDEE